MSVQDRIADTLARLQPSAEEQAADAAAQIPQRLASLKRIEAGPEALVRLPTQRRTPAPKAQ